MAIDSVARAATGAYPAASRRDIKLWIGVGILGVFILAAVVGSVVYPVDPTQQSLLNRLQAPSAAHLLGTDAFGRDVLARLISAARIDLPVGILGAVVPLVIGSVLGLISGYVGSVVDLVFGRLGDLIMAFPTYVLIIALIALMGPGVPSLLTAFAIVGWVPYFRLIRGEMLRVKNEDYFVAARLGGLGHASVLIRHSVPNALRPTLAYVSIDVMGAILTLASFSYLGLGIQPPTAEWGAMVADGQAYLQHQWWLTGAPGLCIALLGSGFLVLGEYLERKLRA